GLFMFGCLAVCECKQHYGVTRWLSRADLPVSPTQQEGLRTVTEELRPVTEKLRPVTEELRPVTEKLRPVTEKLRPVTEELRPVTEKLRPVTEKLRPVTEELRPVTEELRPPCAVFLCDSAAGNVMVWLFLSLSKTSVELFCASQQLLEHFYASISL
uniref:Uncharacterized protein n=1 Tax=Pygocentrus nattereri TaxID=42514 RepID=A0AAR2LFD3_PYGNA